MVSRRPRTPLLPGVGGVGVPVLLVVVVAIVLVAGLVLGEAWRTVLTWVCSGVSLVCAAGTVYYAAGIRKARRRADAACARALASRASRGDG